MTSLANLTPRELEILQHVLAGKINKAIAKEMTVNLKTVEFHLDNIYKKIAVQTHMMASVWAVHHGLQIANEIIPSWKDDV